MFGIDSTEFLLIVIVAVVVIGPKDLPRALYKIGQVVGKGRAMARHFRTGLDAMIREAELEELQKQWDKENARIMAETALPEPVMTEKPLIEGEPEAPVETPPVETPAVETPPVETTESATPAEGETPEEPKGAAAS